MRPVFNCKTASIIAGVLLSAGCVSPVIETAGLTPPAGYQTAETAYQRGDLAAAREAFRSFARQNSTSPFVGWAWYWQGRIDLKEERYEDALLAFGRALDCRPETVLKGPVLVCLGDVQMNRREYRKALVWYRRVEAEGLGTTVRQDELYFKTGLAFFRAGDTVQADRYFKQVEMFPGSQYIEEARRRTGRDAALTPAVHYVLLGKATRWESAERLRKDVSEAGFEATVERVTAPAGDLYDVRVYLGGREEALRAADALRVKGFSPVIVP